MDYYLNTYKTSRKIQEHFSPLNYMITNQKHLIRAVLNYLQKGFYDLG